MTKYFVSAFDENLNPVEEQYLWANSEIEAENKLRHRVGNSDLSYAATEVSFI